MPTDEILWSPTWPDSENDFKAMHGDIAIGRVLIHRLAESTDWRWFSWTFTVPGYGAAESRVGAMRELEDVYWESLKRRKP